MGIGMGLYVGKDMHIVVCIGIRVGREGIGGGMIVYMHIYPFMFMSTCECECEFRCIQLYLS